MKTLGLIGGTGWVSSLEYYRLLNEEINRRLGGLEAARCILYSLNFADVDRLKRQDPEQRGVCRLVVEAAQALKAAGAQGLLLCANTLHWFAPEVEKAVSLPLVHIAAATAAEIRRKGLSKVGLLGTRPTMEKDFYKRTLAAAGIETFVPEEAERAAIESAILEEMVKGIFRNEVRQKFLEIMARLIDKGAQGIILGCTEIPLLIGAEDPGWPLFDTLAIHVRAAVDFALAS